MITNSFSNSLKHSEISKNDTIHNDTATQDKVSTRSNLLPNSSLAARKISSDSNKSIFSVKSHLSDYTKKTTRKLVGGLSNFFHKASDVSVKVTPPQVEIIRKKSTDQHEKMDSPDINHAATFLQDKNTTRFLHSDDPALSKNNAQHSQEKNNITAWFKNHSDNLNMLSADMAKDLYKIEREQPKVLKEKIIDQIVSAYQKNDFKTADSHLELIRPQLSSLLMAEVDKSVIDTLKTSENSTLSEIYQKRQVDNQSIHYSDVLMLNELVKNLESGRSLDRVEQEKILSDSKDKLETINIDRFTPEQQELLQTAKKRVTNLESALPLIDKSQVNRSDILKTIAGSGGLAVCLTALGTLIALLVKLGHSTATDKSDDTISDQTDTIATKKSELETQKDNIEALKSREKELLDKGANLSEKEIKERAESAGLQEAIKENAVVYNHTNEGVKDPKPSPVGEKIIEKFVNEALEKHRENKNSLNEIQDKINPLQSNINELQAELDSLNVIQGNYNAASKNTHSNNTKTETGILSSIGMGAFSLMGGVSGLFALNHSKVIPKFKLSRTHKQAVQPLNKIIATNQPEVGSTLPKTAGMGSANNKPLIRNNSI